nr:GyrI-like domain-containing protein [uncultured Acetatifactor sp.]
MMLRTEESQVEKIHECCSIVDRPSMRLVGIEVPVNFESRSYLGRQLNDYDIAKKYIMDGTISFLAKTLGVALADTEIVSTRHQVKRDGNYHVVIGIPVDGGKELPLFLPEHTAELVLPACRYAKMEINEQKQPGRRGYEERMAADEYFIGSFRQETGYVYDAGACPMNTWDERGNLLTKYEPVRKAAGEADRFASLECMPVLLPPMKIACCTRPHGDEEDGCIFDFFQVQGQVFASEAARFYHDSDYYGFPVDHGDSYMSCFGCRVSFFEGLPDCVEKITLPGGEYVHITQKEFNGDNPSIPYEAAFGHMDCLYFKAHPEYEFDSARKVVARFRQGNCASVFVPVRPRGQM